MIGTGMMETPTGTGMHHTDNPFTLQASSFKPQGLKASSFSLSPAFSPFTRQLARSFSLRLGNAPTYVTPDICFILFPKLWLASLSTLYPLVVTEQQFTSPTELNHGRWTHGRKKPAICFINFLLFRACDRCPNRLILIWLGRVAFIHQSINDA
jgi:hypothetical protein